MPCEALPLCPQPRRSFGRQLFQGKASSSPTTPESYQTQACHELQELLSGAQHDGPLSPECGRSFVTPPLSSASTSVGPSPHGNDRLSPLVSNDSYGYAADSATGGRPRKGSCLTAEGQKRKLFVGGIPQDMDQDTLREEFICFGAIKKAWIQRAREGSSKYASACHRGFGFVIFQHDDVLDNLLQGELSKFIFLSGGCKVEVKRALSSREMTQGSQWTTEIADAAEESGNACTAASGACLMEEPRPCHNQGSIAYEVTHSPPVFYAVPVLSSMPAVQSAQTGWGHASPLLGVASANTGLHPAHGFSAMHPADLATPASCSSPETLQQRASELYGPELASALMCAMPDHYED